MSLALAKTAFATALANVTFPASATSVENGSHTTLQRIDTEQFGEDIPLTATPYARVHIPAVPSDRFTMGGDTGSYKKRNYTAFIFLYWATWAKNWNAGGKYFDGIVDAIQTYFDDHASAPGQGGISPGNGAILAWGLKQDARVELPERFEDGLYWRATIAIDVVEVTI